MKKRTSRSPCSDNSDQDTGKLVGFTILILSLCVVGASEYQAATRGRKHLIKHKAGHPGAEPGSPEFWYHVGFSVCLVLAGGVFSGSVVFNLNAVVPNSVFRLTLGLMGLDELHLRVLATSSEDIRQRKDAQTGDLLHYPPHCSRKLT